MIDGKQHLSNKKKAAAQRLMRTEAYAEKVRTLFAKTVNEILVLNKTMPTLEDGVMYSFDGDSMKKQKEVEALLRRLSSTVTMAVQNGIKLEWDAANKECDQFITSVLGKKVLSTPEFTAYMDRNTAARDAFIGRTENGLDLSKRVWKSVKQLREEMEVAMTVAIGEGDSASSMSRKVREYLNNPDLMFRRFRYKKGEKDIIDTTTGEIVGTEPIYGRKWKKRIKEEKTGKYKWIDYDRDTYKSGTGVYKSSARNAMRVTRTETNIAYRRADNARWQNMDFVLGQHIELSRSHPKKDICDDLAGDYPKDFVFDGWHPQCFCVCTPILMDEAEMAKVTEAFLKGETYKPKGKPITEYPQNFKDWVTDHKDKIEIARKNGTEPYFLHNNALAVDNIINPQPKKLTPLEIAEKRHAARTTEQVEAIKRAAVNRAKSISVAKQYLDNFKDFPDSHTSALNNAYKHADWDTVRTEALVLARRKRTIVSSSIKTINDAKSHKDIDVSALQEAISLGNIKQIQLERQKIEGLIRQKEKSTTIHPAIKKQYTTNADVNDTFRQINLGLSEKWFENGDLDLTVENQRGNNGSTNMNGLVKLKKDRIDGVKSALSKIGTGKEKDITAGEADAMATFWHEITHNRNKLNWVNGKFQRANFCNTALQRSFMELANEYVARNTLPEFYKTLGCKETPHSEYIKTRTSTGYNDMVTNYDYVVDKLGLDKEKVLNAVRNHLYNKPYNDQRSGLIDGLLQGGITDKDGKALKKTVLKALVGLIREAKDDYVWDGKAFIPAKKEERIDDWMRANGIL